MDPIKELKFVEAVLSTLSFAGMDQNPKGIRDILGRAIYELERREQKRVQLPTE